MSDTATTAPARTRTAAAKTPAPEGAAVTNGTVTDTKASAKEPTYTAKLVRGANYSARVGGKVYRFKGGEARGPIPESVKEYLEETAIDHNTMTDGEGVSTSVPLCKFEFVEV